eukprot:CAMPEP_0117688944 /NCGR_PEP_ID=MMETSP0804-20121206/24164_1 /TAXON_ID=1074897 /ORGANISM="Tetraselmis astigmatica, Strain CCMP880" /LENGTH=56 /DNA_ID=CAMNT_0005501559 /DNA_START=474 /DNA_END=642 /DNA_ORIENTATION=+
MTGGVDGGNCFLEGGAGLQARSGCLEVPKVLPTLGVYVELENAAAAANLFVHPQVL